MIKNLVENEDVPVMAVLTFLSHDVYFRKRFSKKNPIAGEETLPEDPTHQVTVFICVVDFCE